MSTRTPSRSTFRIHRGSSLVEILVVLVVLVIGIFGIVRLFPQGFGTIRATERTTIAQGLARGFEEFFRAHAANLPQGIVGIDPVTGAVLPGLDVRSLFFFNTPETAYQGPPAALALDDPRFSGPNRWRHVLGEVVRIPPPTTQSPYLTGGAASFYTLNFSPIYVNPAAPEQRVVDSAGRTASLGLSVYNATPQRRVVYSTLPQDAEDLTPLLQDQSAYGINYETTPPTLYFPVVDENNTDPAYGPTRPRLLKLECSYTVLDPQGNAVRATTIPNLLLTIPWKASQSNGAPPGCRLLNDAATNTFFGYECDIPPPPALPGGYTWRVELGTDFLYRRFHLLAAADAFSSFDPLEYKLLNANFGLIAFNPLGATVPLSHAAERGLVAKVDYDVDDWFILREDLVVPEFDASAQQRVPLRLMAAPIKKVGDLEENLNLVVNAQGQVTDHSLEYSGLLRGYDGRPGTAVIGAIDVFIADLSSGLFLDNVQFVAQGGRIDYRAGTLRFPPSLQWQGPGGALQPTAELTGGKHVRVYYRSGDDWGVAVQKPFSNYLREMQGPSFMGVGQFFQAPGGFLIFPATDGEQSVMVDYGWRQCGDAQCTPAAQRRRTEAGELLRVQAPDSASVSPEARTFWWARLGMHDSLGGVDSPAPPPGVVDPNCGPCGTVAQSSIQVQGVRGASFTTRVFWREGTDWRHLTQEAVLTRDTR